MKGNPEATANLCSLLRTRAPVLAAGQIMFVVQKEE